MCDEPFAVMWAMFDDRFCKDSMQQHCKTSSTIAYMSDLLNTKPVRTVATQLPPASSVQIRLMSCCATPTFTWNIFRLCVKYFSCLAWLHWPRGMAGWARGCSWRAPGRCARSRPRGSSSGSISCHAFWSKCSFVRSKWSFLSLKLSFCSIMASWLQLF